LADSRFEKIALYQRENIIYFQVQTIIEEKLKS